jgi:hypothetical protein
VPFFWEKGKKGERKGKGELLAVNISSPYYALYLTMLSGN